MNEHTSKELSQSLHDKGFRGEHESIWIETLSGTELWPYSAEGFAGDPIPAYTFTEIWGVLPHRYWVEKNMYYWTIRTDQHQRCCIEVRHSHGALKQTFKSLSPAEAVGLLLEWLIDNGHVEVE